MHGQQNIKKYMWESERADISHLNACLYILQTTTQRVGILVKFINNLIIFLASVSILLINVNFELQKTQEDIWFSVIVANWGLQSIHNIELR